jgi:ABC-type nitrate/sulfonate/bicarbonate transport system permease component
MPGVGAPLRHQRQHLALAFGQRLYLIDTAAKFQLTKLVAATFFLALLAMTAMTIARLIERWVVRWKFV